MNELILLVDGCPWKGEMLRSYLVNQGYRVLLASDAKQALDKVSVAEPDLILVDLASSGRALTLLKSQAALSKVPVVAIAETSLAREQALDPGADFFLCRPISLRELAGKLRRWLSCKKAPASLCARLLGA